MRKDEIKTTFADIKPDVYLKVRLKQKVNDKLPKSKNRIKPVSVILSAFVLFILISVALPVAAKYSYSEASNEIVKFYDNHFHITLREIKSPQKNIEELFLPKALMNSDNPVDISEDEDYKVTTIESKQPSAFITITEYKNEDLRFLIGNSEIGEQYTRVKQLNKNGIDIFIFESEYQAYIYYAADNTEYDISLPNCRFETAIEIAETTETIAIN